jgi:hypothetical protein
MNNRLEVISYRLLASNQAAFVKGRYILESVVAAHEILHHTVKDGGMGICNTLRYDFPNHLHYDLNQESNLLINPILK